MRMAGAQSATTATISASDRRWVIGTEMAPITEGTKYISTSQCELSPR